jgi:alpha-amylase/alpha-mannosidase (GH57 family)
MNRFVCIHGHFYQPPREDPESGLVPEEPSAAPFHDWNERIAHECYRPNARARLLDARGHVAKLVNNYARISFDFGPTLLSWLEKNAPDVYRAVLQADRESQKRFSGHGSALAQAYHHSILPLANSRDKFTEVHWGLRDFEHRFGRRPEGMWLPETAVDVETLEAMAYLGLRFVLLAPHQVRSVHKKKNHYWYEVPPGEIDSGMPYEIPLPSGRRVAAFFYDGPISRAVAFENLLSDGETFARRLLGAFAGDSENPRLVHIATDGETYGHHHKFGDMALAYALERIDQEEEVRLTNYGEHLARFEPTHQVEIREKTSWSCPHGVERWRGGCDCRTGAVETDLSWRQALREAFDGLRDAAGVPFERRAARLLKDPWEARDRYVEVVLDPSRAGDFLAREAQRGLSPEERSQALGLMEMQRELLAMYASCGWFFDRFEDVSAQIVVRRARRAADSADLRLGGRFRARLEERLCSFRAP